MRFRSLYQGETPLGAYFRRRQARQDDLTLAWVAIRRARAYNQGRRSLGCVLVSAEDASEENIRVAIRRLELASHGSR